MTISINAYTPATDATTSAEDRAFFIEREARNIWDWGLGTYAARDEYLRDIKRQAFSWFDMEKDAWQAKQTRAVQYRETLINNRAAFKNRLAHNKTAFRHNKQWRWAGSYYSAVNLNRKIHDARRFGRELASALARGNEDLVADLFAEYRGDPYPKAAYTSHNAHDLITDNFTACEHCGEVEPSGAFSSVRVSRRSDEDWCDACVEEHSVRCYDCDDRWARDTMRTTRGDNDICPSCYNSDYFTCASCDSVVPNDYYGEDGCCSSCCENDDEDSSRDGLSGYHDADRSWRTYNKEPAYPFADAPPMGVEIEVFNDDNRAHAVMELRELANTEDSPSQLILEEDGSLDSSYGFEVITDPMGLHEWQKYGPALLKTMKDTKTVGWDARNGRYGIHITISRHYLSPLQEARMMMFMAATDNYEFIRAMAQRPDIYSPRLSIGQLSPTEQSITRINGANNSFRQLYNGRSSKYQKKIAGVGKYAPINFKDKLAEIRIFQSTTHPQSFLKNLEFVSALVEWTSTAAATGSKWYYLEFLEWLRRRPLTRKHYPNLVGYLEREYHPVKGEGQVRNKWRTMVPRQTLEAPVVLAESEVAA